ncbi:MAG: 4'-phosphopantetheinyl transferase superfamily protein [Capsulimonadaceae bacterium]|nr:4'-phosphopantetheinyl transferase superfamily protein [Capsulimonadaceae bacterium]
MNPADIAWQTLDAPPPLIGGELHVWRIQTGRMDSRWAAQRLNQVEAARADRIIDDRMRIEWAASRVALRTLLGGYLVVKPERIVFNLGESGKPFLEGKPIEFNLSHTGGLALAAFATGNPVGIDVEYMREDLDPLDVAPAVFAPDELRRVQNAAPDCGLIVFYGLWTHKEAWLKMLGTGLVDDLSAYSLAHLPAHLRPSRLCDLPAGPGYKAAAALKHPIDAVRLFDFGFDQCSNP